MKGLLVEGALKFLGWDLVDLVGDMWCFCLRLDGKWVWLQWKCVAFGVGGLVDSFGVVVGLVVEDSNGMQVVA